MRSTTILLLAISSLSVIADESVEQQTCVNLDLSGNRSELSDDQQHERATSSLLGDPIATHNETADTNFRIDLVSDSFYNSFPGAHNSLTVSEVARISLAAKYQFADYLSFSMHKYDSYHELRVSGGPKVNQELCLRQLEDLSRRAKVQSRERMQSRDINLYQLLDTFGQIPHGVSAGSTFWSGSYGKCLRAEIDTYAQLMSDERSLVDTRFCWASLRFKSWQDERDSAPSGKTSRNQQVLKAGVCLPRACDSLNYKYKFQLIESLLEHQNSKYVYRDEIKLVDVYCLPDEESPLRLWYHDGRNRSLVLVAVAWLSFLAYATYRSETLRLRTGAGESSAFNSFSILHNLRRLFDCRGSDVSRGESRQTEGKVEQTQVEFKVLDGFRVISTWSIIFAHTLMVMPMVGSNEQDATTMISKLPFLIGNLLPAFAVNSFFAITGVLTSYYSFKHNEKHHFISSPLSWCALIARRYLRIMPTYIIVIAYLKYLAKFTGSGPFWDYATSSLGQRRRCEQESWLLTVLLGANLKPPLEQCVPSAWYLANDFQFLLVTPLVLALLHKIPDLGQRLLTYAVGLAYANGVVGILLENTGDLTPVAKFSPHGFKTYVENLSYSYTRPHHRIPAYLSALIAGHVLYRLERNRLRAGQGDGLTERSRHDDVSREMADSSARRQTLDWPPALSKYGAALSLLFAWVVILITPLVARRLPLNELGAKITVALSMPTFHLMYSLAVTVYILLASTGGGYESVNNFLAAKFWKPFARLSLCVLLINIEVIYYLSQISVSTRIEDENSLAQSQVIALLCSYFVSMVMFVTIEAPVKNGINLAISWLGSRVMARRKGK